MAPSNHYRPDEVRRGVPQYVGWGIFDDQRREHGMVIHTFDVTVLAGEPSYAAETPELPTSIEPGEWLAANVQTTRSGKPYGACQRTVYFLREAERQRYISARIEQARKRIKPARLVCYACDAEAVAARDRRPEGGKVEPACGRHAEPKAGAL